MPQQYLWWPIVIDICKTHQWKWTLKTGKGTCHFQLLVPQGANWGQMRKQLLGITFNWMTVKSEWIFWEKSQLYLIKSTFENQVPSSRVPAILPRLPAPRTIWGWGARQKRWNQGSWASTVLKRRNWSQIADSCSMVSSFCQHWKASSGPS
jgi:hypothetical protein